MNNHTTAGRGLTPGILLLAAIAALAHTAPAQSPNSAQLPAFEVATIKPAAPESHGKSARTDGLHFTASNTTLCDLIQFAYNIQVRQVVGAPPWCETASYDVAATAGGPNRPDGDQWKQMVQHLLTDRFALASHRDKKEMPIYALEVGKNGPRLTATQADTNTRDLFSIGGSWAATVLHAKAATMSGLAALLQGSIVDKPVTDRTNLAGRFDFDLTYHPEAFQSDNNADAAPVIFTAIQEQLGLKLEPAKGPVEVFMIDHAEKPSAN